MVTRLIAEVLLLLFFVCNTVKWIAESKKWNGHFTFESVIDSWGARVHDQSKTLPLAPSLSFDVVCVGSPVIIM